MRPAVNFLLSSAGRRGELVSILHETSRALGRGGGVYCVDRSALSAAGQLADGYDLVPSVADPDFISAVLEVCERRSITHVIPTIDTELPVLAAARAQFEARGVHVWVSDPETIAIARDKRATHAWLVGHDFPAPRQLDLAEAIEAAAAGHLDFPVIAKPAAGSSSLGLVRATGTTALDGLDASLDYVVEEVAPGVEHTVDVWVDRSGRCRSAVPRRRLETRAGEVSKGVTVRDPAVINLATRIAEALPGARGVLNIQVFADPESGAVHVIEINARFGGGFPLTWAAGGRFPLWGVLDLEGSEVPTSTGAWQDGLLMLRYDQGVYLPASQAIT